MTWLCDKPDEIDISDKPRKHTKVLSLAQDIINVASNGRKPMSKCVGLAVALKIRLISKEFVELYNKNGHCVSYDTVLRIETKWADYMLAKNEGYSSIPSNIVCNQLTQAVAANSD